MTHSQTVKFGVLYSIIEYATLTQIMDTDCEVGVELYKEE